MEDEREREREGRRMVHDVITTADWKERCKKV